MPTDFIQTPESSLPPSSAKEHEGSMVGPPPLRSAAQGIGLLHSRGDRSCLAS
jgi:hypothetical protein